MWKPLTVLAVTGLLAGCGAVPALQGSPGRVGGDQAPQTPAGVWVPPLPVPAPAAVGGADGVGYTCWDAYGNPQPQASPTCATGWGGRPPEHPLPTGNPNTGIVP